MQFDDHPAPPPPTPGGPSRRAAWLAAAAVALLVVVVVVSVVVNRSDEVTHSPASEPSSPRATAAPTTTINIQTEVVARLREILKVRDNAFHSRDPDLLSAIYTVDCSCLEGDTNAIRELLTKNYRLIGGATSIRVRRIGRVNGRLWLVIADFQSAPLRIETQGGALVRQEPAGSNLFQFALAKPTDATEWLLGRASSYKDG